MNPEKNKKSDSDDDILATAMKRFELASEAETQIRKEAVDDLNFRAGKQWPDDVKRARELDNRPCLTINRLPQFLRQITNDQRQNRPSMKVNPVDDQGDIETAKILQGIVRHIEYASNADVAYDTAFDGAATHGFGYFRVVTDYCDPMSFEQEIKIKRIKDPFSVYLDPSYSEPDGSDANWAQIVEVLTKDEFKAQYPEAKLSQMDDWISIGSGNADWIEKEGCRVAEYFDRTFKRTNLYQLSNGKVVSGSKPPELQDGTKVVGERESLVPVINWYKHNGFEILERTTWPGKWIPIIPVIGDEIFIEGKRILEGVIRHAKDPQRMYNYWASSETETIALAPRAPFIGVEGQFEGHELKWKTANTRNHAFLEYKPKSSGGVPAGPPQRNVYEPPVQAITQARMASAEDMKATTGVYDASLGNRSNENSGVAIQRRNTQAQVSNFHFTDNFARSLRHGGRIVVDLIPKVYDTERAVRIIGDEGDQEIALINQVFQKDGKEQYINLSIGTYDVTVSSGPSFQTKRQEAVASMMSLTQSLPNTMQAAADLMVKNMDWPGAQEIAERLKKMLPPGIAESDKDQPPIPPQVQQQMTQMQQTIQQLAGQFQAAHDMLQNKKLELESKERIAIAQIESEMRLELMRIDAVHAKTVFEKEIQTLHKRLDLVGQNVPIGIDANGAGQNPAAPPQASQPQPTGGPSPGQPMGV